jgi:antirestriction protein ArdC
MATGSRKTFPDRASLYQGVTEKIIAEIEDGRVPWIQPSGGAGNNR